MKESRAPAKGAKVLPLRIGKDFPVVKSCQLVSSKVKNQSFPASGSLLMSWFFASGGQSIGVSASASVLPMNIQD